jgi:hypothetical protein
LGDSAYAVRRSIHIYDIVPVVDYASISKIPAVYIYDVVPVHDSPYASRQSIIHAYDVVTQPDLAARSGQVTLSVKDILLTPEWFFRVNKALKLFEFYTPFELALVSTIPTIYANDFSVVYDLGASVSTVKMVSVLDKLITDGISYSKSYSPLFFTLFGRSVPIRYLTLSVSDYIPISESAQVKLVKVASAVDYVGFDSASYSRSYSPLLFTMLARRVPIRYLTLSVSDRVAASDSASLVKIKVLSVLDVIAVADRIDIRNIAVHAYDYITYDYVPHMSPSYIRYRSLYANVGMRTISVFDRTTPYESIWVGPRVVAVYARDYLVSDGSAIVKKSVHAYDVVTIVENVNIVRIT